jgi:hypothetical protein
MTLRFEIQALRRFSAMNRGGVEFQGAGMLQDRACGVFGESNCGQRVSATCVSGS